MGSNMNLSAHIERVKTFASAENKKSIVYSKLHLLLHSYDDAGTRIENIPGWFDRGDVLAYRSLVQRLPAGAIVIEVGTWMGRSLANVATIRGDVTFLGVDAFARTKRELMGLVGAEVARTGSSTRFYFRFLRNMMRHAVGNFSILRMNSEKAATLIRDRSADLIFIDAGHSFEEVQGDIVAWRSRVKLGGILSGHDYHPGNSVAKAVVVCLGEREIETFPGSSVWAVVLRPSTSQSEK